MTNLAIFQDFYKLCLHFMYKYYWLTSSVDQHSLVLLALGEVPQ